MTKITRKFLLLGSALILASCISLPWKDEKRDEVNIAFHIVRNQLVIPAELDGHTAQIAISVAQPVSIVSRSFTSRHHVSGDAARLILGDRVTRAVDPVTMDLNRGVDAIAGVDVWSDDRLTIDYFKQLLTLSTTHRSEVPGFNYRFGDVPTVPVYVDGRRYDAIIDTSLPDTLLLPTNGKPRRSGANVSVGDERIGRTDVQYARSSRARIGNRILARFLVTVDYRMRVVGLWRDPRA